MNTTTAIATAIMAGLTNKSNFMSALKWANWKSKNLQHTRHIHRYRYIYYM